MSSSNGSGNPSEPSIKGILKHDHNPRKSKRGINWDETNIAEAEKLRGTRQRIIEPKTPYHYYTSSDEEGSDRRSPKSPRVSTNGGADESFAAKFQVALEEECESTRDQKLEAEEEDNMKMCVSESAENAEAEKHANNGTGAAARSFKEKRKQHYNEYKVMQEFRKKNNMGKDQL